MAPIVHSTQCLALTFPKYSQIFRDFSREECEDFTHFDNEKYSQEEGNEKDEIEQASGRNGIRAPSHAQLRIGPKDT